jgi:hypothetical protein
MAGARHGMCELALMVQSEVTSSICTAEERLTGQCILKLPATGVSKNTQTNINKINIKQHKTKSVNKNILSFFKNCILLQYCTP